MGEVAAIITDKQLEIHGLPAVSSVSPADEFPLFSNAEQEDRKITFENLKAGVSYTLRPFGVRRLVVTTTDEHTVNVTAAAIFVENPNNGTSLRINALDVSADIEVSGAGGLDTGSEAGDTWYYVWVISTGSSHSALLSTSSSAPTLPSGYTYRTLVGVVRNDDTGDFVPFIQRGYKYLYVAPLTIFYEGDDDFAEGIVDISEVLAPVVPTEATNVQFGVKVTPNLTSVPGGAVPGFHVSFYQVAPNHPSEEFTMMHRTQLTFDSEIIEHFSYTVDVPLLTPQTLGVGATALIVDVRLDVLSFDLDL